MSHTPPHIGLDEEQLEELAYLSRSKIGPQGPSKYGAGGRRVYKAKGRGGKK